LASDIFANRPIINISSSNDVCDVMDDERVQMQNALYRIQESAQSAAENGLRQGNTENLRERRIANVSRSLSETLTQV
jgi:hypothetical protein